MKLELEQFENGFSDWIDYQWVDTEAEDENYDVSPVFSTEEDAIEWYNRLKTYFCPNKNCHVKEVDPI